MNGKNEDQRRADEPVRIGILGLTHDHIWDQLDDVQANPAAELVGAADANIELLDRFRAVTGAESFASSTELLESGRLDAAYVYGDNASGAELAVEALNAGLHVLIEKPMAADLRGADEMIAAARNSGRRLMVNWPFAWWPQLQRALQMAAHGDIGRVWQVKYRAAHEGPKEFGCSEYFCEWLYDEQRNGGGALMDYCGYGAILAQTLLGSPSRVTAAAGRLVKEDILVEDNAIVVMTYPRAIAVAEGSWTHIGKLGNYTTMIFGETGTLLIEPRHGGRLLHATLEHPEGVETPVEDVSADGKNATAHFIHALRSGAPFHNLCEDRACRDAQEILQAAIESVDAGVEVSLPLKA